MFNTLIMLENTRVKNLTRQCVDQSDFTGARDLTNSHFHTVSTEMCPERINDWTWITCIWEENSSLFSDW